jgi:hypothetical protein
MRRQAGVANDTDLGMAFQTNGELVSGGSLPFDTQ